ncbi:hypothetical protein BIV57_15765 [Mangrovactinospora gilvigrisea]|uniref:RNA polymerase subunit sigma n=1 Tax=Mangrovactinospora gilvigrisea TaxID=1428644 RepID=A0A1J7C4P8_9ACTN|nr:sigma-70 family RNA polymerase sigma factor [Mangrovactinospora gilvigrisea]OIV36536.1 hypothetical protein BIV57_15765 [Mangrovactinospora gilvigrisea]
MDSAASHAGATPAPPPHGPAPIRWDLQIQERLARGEEAALTELYDQFAPLVLGLAHRILHDQAAAEEVAGEVFAAAWAEPDAFDPERGSLRSWISTLAHRRAVERKRRVDPRPGADGSGIGVADEPPPEPAGAEEEVLAAAARARVRQIVEALPPSLRQAVELTYFEGLTYPQTARRIGVTPAVAKQRIRLGLQILATGLESVYES